MKHPEFRKYELEYNVATPEWSDASGRVINKELVNDTIDLSDIMLCLILWLEPKNFENEIIISHEIGHWILFLDGFTKYSFRHNQKLTVEFSTMHLHFPLYSIQRKFGFDPQHEIDLRVKHDIERRKNKSGVYINNEAMLADVFYLADDIINCSEKYRELLLNVLKNKRPEVYHNVLEIDGLRHDYNLDEKDENNAFVLEVLKKYNLMEKFEIFDVIDAFNKEISLFEKLKERSRLRKREN